MRHKTNRSLVKPAGVHGTISVLGPPVPRHNTGRAGGWGPLAAEASLEEYLHPALPRRAPEPSPESLRFGCTWRAVTSTNRVASRGSLPPWLGQTWLFHVLWRERQEAQRLSKGCNFHSCARTPRVHERVALCCNHRRGPSLETRGSPFKDNMAVTVEGLSGEGAAGQLAQPPEVPADAVGRNLTCGIGLGGLSASKRTQVRPLALLQVGACGLWCGDSG